MKRKWIYGCIIFALASCVSKKESITWQDGEFLKVRKDNQIENQCLLNHFHSPELGFMSIIMFYANGRKESEIWLNENKRPVFSFTFDSSGTHFSGPTYIYWKNGEIQYQLMFKMDKLNGSCLSYSQSGKLETISIFQNDTLTKIIMNSKNKKYRIDSTFIPFKIFIPQH